MHPTGQARFVCGKPLDNRCAGETCREIDTRTRSLVPRPWWQVGLVVLPGLISLPGQVSSASLRSTTGLGFLALAVLILLAISSVLLAATRRSPFKVPVWGLIPLGWLAGAGLVWTKDPFRFYPTCFLLVVTGLLPAEHNGLSVSLFVLAGGMLTTSWHVEPSMYFWDSPFCKTFLNVGMTVLFTIPAPILVLRSRSILAQAVRLLLPVAVYAAGFVSALSRARGIPVSRSVSRPHPLIALFATVAIAAAVYTRISARDSPAGEVQGQSAI